MSDQRRNSEAEELNHRLIRSLTIEERAIRFSMNQRADEQMRKSLFSFILTPEFLLLSFPPTHGAGDVRPKSNAASATTLSAIIKPPGMNLKLPIDAYTKRPRSKSVMTSATHQPGW